MDNIYEIINNRSSCRSFTGEEITEDVLQRILDAACKAPSGGGFQTYSIIQIKNNETKKGLARLCRGQKFIERAPVCLVFCIDYRRIKRINEVIPAPCNLTDNFMNFWMAILDTAISAQTMCLAAEAEGLKSVFIGNIINTVDRVSDLLNLPEYVCPSIMVVLGYPSSKCSSLSKKYNINVVVHDEQYKDMDIDDLMTEYEKKYEDWNMKPAENIVNKVYETCFKLHGNEFAEKVKAYVEKNNEISSYQFWMGYYYLNQDGFLDIDGYVNFMKKQGFNWLVKDGKV